MSSPKQKSLKKVSFINFTKVSFWRKGSGIYGPIKSHVSIRYFIVRLCRASGEVALIPNLNWPAVTRIIEFWLLKVSESGLKAQ